jgi:AraC-like DNA-binding protein
MRDSTLQSHYESVERVITVMRNQLDQPMTLHQMARIGFASPYHFSRTFREVTGVPPVQFLYALRLDQAKRLLTETQKKVIDICYEVGYTSVGTFSRRFADVLGAFASSLTAGPSLRPQPQAMAGDKLIRGYALRAMSPLPAISAGPLPWAFSIPGSPRASP